MISERRKTLTLLAFSFVSGSSYIMTRAIAVTLFLARIGSESLPIAFAASAVLVATSSLLARKSIPYYSARWFACFSYVLLGLLSFSLSLAIANFDHSLLLLVSLYVLAEIRGSVNTINLITLCNEAFSTTDSKQKFTIVASGAPIAGIIIGVLLGLEATILSAFSILMLAVAFDVVASIVVLSIRSKPVDDEPDVDDDEELVETSRVYQQQLGLLLALEVIVLTLVEFQWESSIEAFYGTNETSMLSYLAFFFAASDTLIVIFQWFIAGRLLDRFGLKFGLCTLPLLLCLVGLASIVAKGALILIIIYTVGKGLNVIRRATYDPALSSAYGLLESSQRRESVMINRGIVKPIAELLTAFLLLGIGFWLLKRELVSYLWVILIPPWIYFALQVAAKYRTHTQLEHANR